MSALDSLKNAAGSLGDKISNSNTITGNAERAYLLLRREIMDEDDGKDSLLTSADKIAEFANELSDSVDNLQKTASLLGMNSTLSSIAGEKGYIPIKVQFNPSSISYSGLRGVQEMGHDGTFMNFDRPVETMMSMELIFDTMDINNSFMLDKTLKDVATGTVKKRKSVRPIVELLIASTVFNSTRWIGFAWNKMIFWGELVNVSATYTMFDTSGDPVRAKVSVQIRQDQVNKAAEISEEKAISENRIKAEKEWDKQFKALGKKKPMIQSAVSNVLNTNF